MKHRQKSKKPRLNDGLCPEKLEICVPKTCLLLGYDWTDKGDDQNTGKRGNWKDYVEKLAQDNELLVPDYMDESCHSCDCEEGRVLRGKLAVAHACRVHEKIHRQVLALEQVSAVDVGFAIWERKTTFADFLAIRVHVNKKRPAEQLVRVGLSSLTLPYYRFDKREIRELSFAGPRSESFAGSPNCPRRSSLEKLLREELEGRNGIWRELGRYPISGVRREDLSIFCPPEVAELRTLGDIRLCICGVPIDIVGAQYSPSITHPGGDADSGVFVDPPRGSNRLKNDEQLLIGRGRVNPLVGGISVGSVTGQAGTLGAIVWDRTDGTPCVLSNWHVLAGTATAQVGQPTYQPALFDGGTEDDVVANLKRWHLGEKGDVAVAELSGTRHAASGEILGLWHPISGYLPPQLNMEIRKWGRTTGFTQGFVDGINLATNIDYGNGVVRYFKNQFHIAPLFAGEDVSQVGDSGSLVVTSLRPVDQKEDLAKLCGWLRQCCDARGGSQLCSEIRAEIVVLKCKCLSECQNVPPDTCTELWEVFDSLAFGDGIDAQDPCETNDYPELCRRIKAGHGRLNEIWEDVKKYAAFCVCVEERLGRLYEKYCRCHDCSNEAFSEVKGISQKLAEKGFEGAPGECNQNEDPLSLCEDIEDLLQFVKKKYKALEKCARFCRCVERTFEQWHERCCRIPQGEELCKKLCKILHSDCKDSTCKDPSALIDCIEEGLRRIQSGSVDSSSDGGRDDTPSENEIKRLLRALVDPKTHDPDALLKALKGSTRRYYRRKKNEKARSATRAYYAVGLIFAGDTPGSPFGEFAVASDVERLAEELRFSLRPVFEPRSSFRELRVRPSGGGQAGRALRSRRSLTPGDQGADARSGGPQPDLEPAQSDSGNRTGGGG